MNQLMDGCINSTKIAISGDVNTLKNKLGVAGVTGDSFPLIWQPCTQ